MAEQLNDLLQAVHTDRGIHGIQRFGSGWMGRGGILAGSLVHVTFPF